MVVAAASVVAVLIFRAIWPDKQRGWQFLIPAAIAAMGVGLWYFVWTDAERIAQLISQSGQAIQDGDCQALEELLGQDYSDRRHSTKGAAIRACSSTVRLADIERIVLRIEETQLGRGSADSVFTARIVFGQRSPSPYGQMLVRAAAQLSKSSGRWLISSVELLEINGQPANWRDIR